MIKQRTILAASVAIIGAVSTVLLTLAFDRQVTSQTRNLHKANHRAALKIVSRDVDDLRRQLVQMNRRMPAGNFDFLFFGRNRTGNMGVHGPSVGTWTPISNAYSSIFRAAFEGISGTSVRILDLTGNLIDASSPNAKKASANELADYVAGTNLVLRSSSTSSRALPNLTVLLILTLLFWLDVGMYIYFITPEASADQPRALLPARSSYGLPPVPQHHLRGYSFHQPVVLQGVRDRHAPY